MGSWRRASAFDGLLTRGHVCAWAAISGRGGWRWIFVGSCILVSSSIINISMDIMHFCALLVLTLWRAGRVLYVHVHSSNSKGALGHA